MYIQGNIKLASQYVFRDANSTFIEFVLIGDGITLEQFRTTNAGIDIVQSGSHSPLDNIEVVNYLDPASPWTFVPGQTRTSHVIVDNYCKPLALTGEHLSDANPCVINCSNCGLVSAKENPIHTVSSSIAYTNGYDKVGVKTIICTNKGCSHTETVEAKALFVCQGYSSPIDGRGEIAIGYTLNNEAISEYEKATGKALKYGVFAVLKEKLGANDIFNANGEAISGAINAEISGNNFVAVEFKITGFTDEHKNLKLAMGVYVSEKDDKTVKFSYLQLGIPEENEKYHFASYNDIINGSI
jgi:hypothetical protein